MENTFETELLGAHAMLRRHAVSLTGNVEEAKDLLQDTLLKALKYKNLFVEGTNISAWLYTIMRNTFLTKKSMESRFRQTVDLEKGQHSPKMKTVKNGAFTKFAWEELSQAMDKIEVQLRTPFMMHCQGFKYREIADDLNIPEGTVKNRIHLAKNELKKRLASFVDLNLD